MGGCVGGGGHCLFVWGGMEWGGMDINFFSPLYPSGHTTSEILQADIFFKTY